MKIRNWRVNLILVLIFLLSTIITGRLIFVQILKGDFYRALAQGLHSPFNETQGERGEIFLKNGEPVAINVNFPYVFASPLKIKNLEETAKILSQILNLEENFVLEKLKKENFFSLIKRKLSQTEVETLKKLNLEGISLDIERGRYYPKESLASSIIGFLGAEGKGQYGLEESYDQILRGENGFKEAKKGSDLILNIDYNIQFEAEELLKKAKENLDFERSQIIVIEPNSGKILALAVYPNFNSNLYEEYAKKGNLDIFKNPVTQELFEPGSVFKIVAILAGLEEGRITPQTTYIDEGSVKIGSDTIYNYDKRIYGQQTMTNVLEKSINTGAVFVEQQIGHRKFLEYLDKLGIFKKTGIDVPEIYSQNKELKKGYEINFATASFGQGIEMTPIQLVRAYCVIANGGKLVTPHLVEKTSDSGIDIEPPLQIISSKTTSQLTAMLVSVVENGFGKLAKIPGYYIAGKTGTAQVPEGGKYSAEKTIQTFVGFGPAFNPQFLILIKLDNPKTKTAEYSAVPIFHDLADYIIHYYQILPDYD